MDLTRLAKDAALVTIGAGVVAARKARAQQGEIEQQLEEQAAQLRSQLAKVAEEVEERLDPVIDALEERLDRLEGRLPDQARETVRSARARVKDAGGSLRSRLASDDTAA
ncbi:MAG TPA: hypothetical protein VFV35_03770 [Acidimicrobiales bacterium]|nr:hypothetical protein [Acidimicrobiales bacterium]